MKKKFSVLFSVLILAAMVLSACAGGNNNGGNNDAGVLETPGAGDVLATPDLMDATPTLAVVDETPAGGAAIETPTVDAGAGVVDMTATPEAGAVGEVTGTPMAEVPVTGDVCVPNRLTNMLDFEVRDNTGEIVGEVDGIVIFRDASLAGATSGQAGDAVVETPAAGDVVETPAADDMAVTPAAGMDAANLANPNVAYVIVDIDDAGVVMDMGNKDVLVPFTAFNALTPETPVQDCAFVFNGDVANLAQAPAFDDDVYDDMYDSTRFTEFNSFWANLGVTVPAADVNGVALGAPVILQDNFDDIDVENANGDDLGEIEDFIIDPATGQVQYAVLAAGGFLGIGERMIPVPMNQLVWGEMDDDPQDLGEMTLNVPEDAWENVPSFDSLDELDFTAPDWNTEIDTFWTGLNGTTTE